MVKKIEGVTTSDLAIKPGSGFGFGTDSLNRKKDPLLQQRKRDKNIDQDKLKKLTGEQTMTTVATFTSNNKTSIGLQYNIIDMHNKTTSDMWELSKIQDNGGSYSFTVKSTMPDQYLTDENLQRNMVAGVSVSLSMSENVNESEVIAESMINAIAKGNDVNVIAEAYLGSNKVNITESSEGGEGLSTLESTHISLLKSIKGINEENVEAIKVHVEAIADIIAGKKTQG